MIFTDIEYYTDAQSVFNEVDKEFYFSPDNLWNLASHSPEIIISNKDCSELAKEFPNVKFVFPEAKFPSYKLNIEENGFNPLFNESNLVTPPTKYKACLVAKSKEDKLIYQKMLKTTRIDLYNINFGKDFVCKVEEDYDVFQKYNFVIPINKKQELKASFLKKDLITTTEVSHQLIQNDPHGKQASYNNAYDSTYFDVFSTILEQANPQLCHKLMTTKSNLLEKN